MSFHRHENLKSHVKKLKGGNRLLETREIEKYGLRVRGKPTRLQRRL